MREKAAPSLEAIQHSPMHEVVYDRLREALSSGEILPGQRLVIRDLADMLGTSVMPVREALRRLEAENAVEAIGGRTLSVPVLTADEFEELGMIRAELEGCAAFEAASRVTPAELDEIEKYSRMADQAAMEQNTDGIALYNRMFHQAINRASRRPLLLRMIESLWLRVGPQMTYAFKNAMVVQNWGREIHGIFHPHRQAIAALRAGNATAAKAAIIYDIDCVCRSIVNNMRARENKNNALRDITSAGRRSRKNSPALPIIRLSDENL